MKSNMLQPSLHYQPALNLLHTHAPSTFLSVYTQTMWATPQHCHPRHTPTSLGLSACTAPRHNIDILLLLVDRFLGQQHSVGAAARPSRCIMSVTVLPTIIGTFLLKGSYENQSRGSMHSQHMPMSMIPAVLLQSASVFYTTLAAWFSKQLYYA